MTYKQAYDKIIEAYFKDEIKPVDSSFCFCGTLSPNEDWRYQSSHKKYPYSPLEYNKMEDALFDGLTKYIPREYVSFKDTTQPGFEDAIFEGMRMALDVLKQIHIERGEVIDEVPEFTKRQVKEIIEN